MNWIAFVLFLIALILKIVNVHVDWVIYLVIIGGLILSAVTGPIVVPWRHN